MPHHIFTNRANLSIAVAQQIAQLSAEAIRTRGRFTVAISGGSLPELAFPPLTADPHRQQIAWQAWHVFLADERCVPLDDEDSNYHLARPYLFDQVPIPASQIYPIDPTLTPQAMAIAYQTQMQTVFGQNSAWPVFDLILLGMGPDGHTASLFPNHPLLDEATRWVAEITDSPKPPPERITLTLPVLNYARQIIFVVTGRSKATAMRQIAAQPDSLPAGRVQPSAALWFVDEAALSGE